MCKDVQSNKVGYTNRTLTPPKTFHSWTQTCYYYIETHSEDADVVTNALLLVLRNALGYPCDVSDFL
jgi:hypothetical protein